MTRHTCFCGLFRSAAIFAKRAWSEELRLVAIPVRMPWARMRL
jgi:hypothetical protein